MIQVYTDDHVLEIIQRAAGKHFTYTETKLIIFSSCNRAELGAPMQNMVEIVVAPYPGLQHGWRPGYEAKIIEDDVPSPCIIHLGDKECE